MGIIEMNGKKEKIVETPCFPKTWKLGENNATCNFFRTREEAEAEAEAEARRREDVLCNKAIREIDAVTLNKILEDDAVALGG